jgi:DNA (cytosine-5)-methyltransferase 1
LKVYDLFSGIGGFHLGFWAADPSFYKFVGSCDIDKYCTWVYNYNFRTKETPRDVTTMAAKDFPNHDILTAGFPCQAFSVAGHRRGFDETRGTLFFDIARILAEKQPRFVLLENVKGLLSHHKGRTFEVIIRTLNELGYLCEWQVLNSVDFAVPQHRERVFVLGQRVGDARAHKRQHSPEDSGASKHLDSRYFNEQAGYLVFPIEPLWRMELKAYLEKTVEEKYFLSDEKVQKILALHPDFFEREFPKYSYCLDANYWKGIAPSHIAKSKRQWVTTDDFRVRRLTPTECEQLQGFPIGFTEKGYDAVNDNMVTISDTQRYKMLGNAVTVNVVTQIARRLRDFVKH